MRSDDYEPKQKIVETSKVIYEGNLYEQYYDPETKETGFVGLATDKKEILTHDCFEDFDVKYVPIRDELLEKGAVTLPTKPIEYGTTEDLEKEIESFIKAWLDVSEEYRQKATWYIMLSWIVDRLHTIPYLRALGDYGTGKTRFLDVIGGICYKPMYVGGAVKSAPIYRIIDLWRGTTIFDEFTLHKSDEKEDIIQILNNGYERGKCVLRCDTNNVEKVRAFDPFGAKILASRSGFDDKALESRCITEIMKSTGRNDIPCFLTEQFYEKRQELQNKLLMYRLRNLDKIKIDESINIDFGNILPRIKQSMMPFTVLFQYDNERLQSFIRYAKEYNKKIIEENATSLDGLIVNAFLQLKENSEPYISSNDIANKIVNDGHYKELNPRVVGKHLRSLGFESILKKTVSGKTIRNIIISDEKLAILKQRYVVENDFENETGQKKIDEVVT